MHANTGKIYLITVEIILYVQLKTFWHHWHVSSAEYQSVRILYFWRCLTQSIFQHYRYHPVLWILFNASSQ